MVVIRCSFAAMCLPKIFLSGQKLAAIMPDKRQIENSAGLDRRGKPHRHELLGVADAAALGQHAPPRADFAHRAGARARLRPFRAGRGRAP